MVGRQVCKPPVCSGRVRAGVWWRRVGVGGPCCGVTAAASVSGDTPGVSGGGWPSFEYVADVFDELLPAAQAGGEWAWERLYGCFTPQLVGYLRTQGVPDVVVDELVSETWLGVVDGLLRFSGDAVGFRKFVVTVCRHRLIDWRRRRQARPEDPGGSRPADGGGVPVFVGSTDDPEAVMQTKAATSQVLELLGRLSDTQREALVLRMLWGLSTREIAQVVGKRRGAVKQAQQRGLNRLRQMLEADSTLDRSEA